MTDDVQKFRDSVIDYLTIESRYVNEDIEAHSQLAPEEKEKAGLLVRNAALVEDTDTESFTYETPINFTKLRAGDEVLIRDSRSETGGRVAIVETNDVSSMTFSFASSAVAELPRMANIIVKEQNTIDSLISAVQDINDGARGLMYMTALGGFSEPKRESRFARIVDFADSEIPDSFNEEQRRSVLMAMRRPSLAYIQGIPGSGKTHLLAVIAKGYACRARDVVVMALTHQAVNNALNKVKSQFKDIPVVKIGKKFKNVDLVPEVDTAESLSEYLDKRKERGHFYGDVGNVIGMTFQSALYCLGKRRSPLIPQIILFDEAGQVPLTHAVAVGTFGCGSVVFIGDDVQMPPIYHEKLRNNPLSKSVFEQIKALYPSHGEVLSVTYRMNPTISSFVSDMFYCPRKIELVSAPCTSNNHIDDPIIEYVECSCPGATDENEVEAEFAVNTAKKYLNRGIPIRRLAIITPYRRQVRLVHKSLRMEMPENADLPLVDTVERLQGQDVDVIILTFAVNDCDFFKVQRDFILNHNRLNVMFSRATSKVVVISSRLVREGLDELAKRARGRPCLWSNNGR